MIHSENGDMSLVSDHVLQPWNAPFFGIGFRKNKRRRTG